MKLPTTIQQFKSLIENDEEREAFNLYLQTAPAEEKTAMEALRDEAFPPIETAEELNSAIIEGIDEKYGGNANQVSYYKEERPPNVSYEQQIEESNRSRAYRGNMLRRLAKKFEPLALFTVGDATHRTGQNPELMAAYLLSEAARPGARVRYDPITEKYYLSNPFL